MAAFKLSNWEVRPHAFTPHCFQTPSERSKARNSVPVCAEAGSAYAEFRGVVLPEAPAVIKQRRLVVQVPVGHNVGRNKMRVIQSALWASF